jgi:putative salt-induced outer membrane protein YdiY
LRADYDLAGHFALYGLTAFDRNPYAGIRSRFAEGAGGVWKVIATDVNQLNAEAGYQHTQQKNLVGPDHNFPALRLASSWKHSISKAASFFQGVEYIPDLQDTKDYRVNSETDIIAPLSAHTAMKFAYVIRFTNEPPLNASGTAVLRKTDRILSAGIQLAY